MVGTQDLVIPGRRRCAHSKASKQSVVSADRELGVAFTYGTKYIPGCVRVISNCQAVANLPV